MAKPYAQDLRERRVRAGRAGQSRHAAARNLMSARAVGSSSCGSLRQQNDGVQKVPALSPG
jgi:hypothetical protein